MKPTIDEVNQAKAESDRLWTTYHDLQNTPEIKAAENAWWQQSRKADELLKQLLATEETKP